MSMNIRMMGLMKKVSVPDKVKVLSIKKGYSSVYTPGMVIGKNYYSSFIDNKQHIYSFLTDETANTCVSFLTEFKSMYNNWPIINEDNEILLSNRLLGGYKNKKITDEVVVNEEEIENMQSYCIFNNLGLLGVTFFDYTFKKNKIDLYISACSLLPDDITIDQTFINKLQIDSLNSIWVNESYPGEDPDIDSW